MRKAPNLAVEGSLLLLGGSFSFGIGFGGLSALLAVVAAEHEAIDAVELLAEGVEAVPCGCFVLILFAARNGDIDDHGFSSSIAAPAAGIVSDRDGHAALPVDAAIADILFGHCARSTLLLFGEEVLLAVMHNGALGGANFHCDYACAVSSFLAILIGIDGAVVGIDGGGDGDRVEAMRDFEPAVGGADGGLEADGDSALPDTLLSTALANCIDDSGGEGFLGNVHISTSLIIVSCTRSGAVIIQ